MRITFLHEVNYLEKPIFEMHEFPEYLSLKGHEISFIHFPEGWTPDQIHRQGLKNQICGRAVKEARLTLYTPLNVSGSLIGRLKAALTAKQFIRKVIEDSRPDVIVSFSIPTSGWQALLESRRAGIPYVFRALDVSHKIRRTAFAPLIKLAEKFVYRNSSHVSANNPAMRDYCVSMGASIERVSVNLPPLDLKHFSGSKAHRLEYRAKLGLTDRDHVIVYMGSFFYFSGLPEVLKSFAKTQDQDIKLLLIGGGEQERELRDQVEKLGIVERVLFTGFVSFEDLPRFLSTADVAINSMHRTLVSNVAFPNKVLQYMASGIPVVSTDLEGLRKTFGQLNGLRLVPSAQLVLRAALELLQEENLHEIGRENEAEVAKRFSREAAVTEFEKLLLRVVRDYG